MKLNPFSYTLIPGPRTHIGYDGYMIFVKADSDVSPSLCFAVYYDSEPKVWHISPVAYGNAGTQESNRMCVELFQCRMADIQDLLKKSDNED